MKTVPVSTWSPTCNADMVTNFPVLRLTLEVAGKHFLGQSGTSQQHAKPRDPQLYASSQKKSLQ